MAQAAGNESVYNIVPVHDTLADHAALQFPEVRAAIAALQTVGSLARPPYLEWGDGMDLLDWLGAFFGFQADNIKNQREHLALLLANGQMRVNPDPIDKLASEVVSSIRKKVTKNYVDWCKFLEIPSNLSIVDSKYTSSNERLELLYTALYLLIWGEAANLRFMPECLCFVFHNMALELNRILEDRIDERSGQPARPAYCEPGGFLKGVVKPLYTVVSGESMASEHGKAPHSAWRNYDDMNEYFWDKRCLTKLGWPLSQSSRYFVHPQSVVESGSAKIVRSSEHKVGKTGFVEQRSFWNIYQSFDRLWIGLILVLQASIILAWNGKAAPWTELQKKDQIARILSIFITWAGLRLLQALLSMIMQYKLVSAETLSVGVRMVLKFIAAVAWTIIFAVLWSSLWNLRRKEGAGFDWTPESNKRFRNMLYAAAVFVVPEALALLLFIIPWVRNFVENSQWRIFHLLTWWFQTRIYVARGLREGLLDNIRYTLFWVIVIATKFAFSYTLQVKPLIEPTKEIIRLPSGAVKYRWPELFGRGTRSAIVAMWAPVILIYMMDLQIWYTVYSSLAGALVGLFQHLGEIRNVEQLKQRFQYFASALQFTIMAEDQYVSHRRFGHSFWVNIRNSYTRFKLRYGFEDDAYKKEDRQIEAGRFAHIWNEIMAIFREEDLISDRSHSKLL